MYAASPQYAEPGIIAQLFGFMWPIIMLVVIGFLVVSCVKIVR